MIRKNTCLIMNLLMLIISCTFDNPSSVGDCSGKTDPLLTAEINGQSFIADTVTAILIYSTSVTPPRYRFSIQAIEDTVELSFTLDHFISDGKDIPIASFNMFAVNNEILPRYGFVRNNVHFGPTLPKSGSMEITRCNREKQVLCGTFMFTAYYPLSDTKDSVFIKNGVIDNVRYEIK